ncbi:MAG: ATP--guanido phosphotransferase [Planctomycetota bacterium]
MLPFDPLTFADRVGSWLTVDGPDHDVVVSCRVRLARNVGGYPFMARLDEKRAVELAARIRAIVDRVGLEGGEASWVDLPQATGLARLLLRERHLASRDHAPVEERTRVAPGRAVVFAETETTSAMVNEEDHLRLQGLAGGFDLGRAFDRVRDLDVALENELELACSSKLGYLTACPTNVGTGMRASVMLHLPALGLVKSELEKVFASAQRTGLAVRGMYGEGSRAAGDYYQISNQVTLGRSEEDLIAELQALVPGIVDFERRVRSLFLEKREGVLRDRVARSIGTLSASRMMQTDAAMQHLSNVRLGLALGLVDGFDAKELDADAIRIQKGHVQARRPDGPGAGLVDAPARDRLRASYLRALFRRGEGDGPDGTEAPDEEESE